MSAVVMERSFRAPLTAEDVRTPAIKGQWCLDAHQVRPVTHYLKADGLRCTCVFDAPDAEALRSAMRLMGLSDPARIWSATLHPGPEDDVEAPPARANATLTVVERSFDEPTTFDAMDELERRNGACMNLYRVRFVRSYFSIDRKRMLCLYESPDTESVRRANRQSGLPFESAWPARIVLPPSGAP